jgi:hypothetical protein
MLYVFPPVQRALMPLLTLMTDAVMPLPRSEATKAAVSANSWIVGRLRAYDRAVQRAIGVACLCA